MVATVEGDEEMSEIKRESEREREGGRGRERKLAKQGRRDRDFLLGTGGLAFFI